MANWRPERNKKYPTLYNLYGIYIDWQIDNNLIEGLGNDPHGIKTFEDFLDQDTWQIVEISFDDHRMLSIDLVLPKLQLLKMIRIQSERIVKAGLKGKDTEKALYQLAKKMNLPIFDTFKYYMQNVPWNLVDRKVTNHKQEKIVIDQSMLNNCIIV